MFIFLKFKFDNFDIYALYIVIILILFVIYIKVWKTDTEMKIPGRAVFWLNRIKRILHSLIVFHKHFLVSRSSKIFFSKQTHYFIKDIYF